MTADCDDLDVVAVSSTYGADVLPRRVDPLFADREGSRWFVEQSNRDSTVIAPMNAALAEDLIERGEFTRLPRPIKAKAGYALVVTELGSVPLYVPIERLEWTLRRIASNALRDVETFLHAGDAQKAEDRAWYACRATPKDVLPTIVLIALVNANGVTPRHLQYLFDDLAGMTDDSRCDGLKAVQALHEQGFDKTLELVREVPLLVPFAAVLPPYLARHHSRVNFLDHGIPLAVVRH